MSTATTKEHLEENLKAAMRHVSILEGDMKHLEADIGRAKEAARLIQLQLDGFGETERNCKHFGKTEYFCNCVYEDICSWRGCLSGRRPF